MKDRIEEENKEKTYGVFDALSDLLEETFVLDPSAAGEKTFITSFEIREMFRDLLDISVNDITITMMKKGFRPNIISGTACWALVRKKD